MTVGHWHSVVILKIKWLQSEIMELEKKLKNKNHGIIYSISFLEHDMLNEKYFKIRKKKIYATFGLICRWQGKLLNGNCLGRDRTVCPFAHHLLTICSPVSDQHIAWHVLDNQSIVGE